MPGYDIDETENTQKHFEYLNLFSLIVLDEDFNVITETLLPEKTYDPTMKFISKDGLYIALHIDNPLYNPDSLIFEKMKIMEL